MLGGAFATERGEKKKKRGGGDEFKLRHGWLETYITSNINSEHQNLQRNMIPTLELKIT